MTFRLRRSWAAPVAALFIRGHTLLRSLTTPFFMEPAPSVSLQLNQIGKEQSAQARNASPIRLLISGLTKNGSSSDSTSSGHTRSGIKLRCGIHACPVGGHAASD